MKVQSQHQNKVSVDKRHSLKIRDCLLGHVSDGGFKKGFNNIQEDIQDTVKEQIDSQDKARAELPLPDINKIADIGQTKGQQMNGESNQQQTHPANSPKNINSPFSQLDLKNHNVYNVFPAYPPGKFYKNDEDVILKKRVEKLEKKQDPIKRMEQKQREAEQAKKLSNLSPFSSRARR